MNGERDGMDHLMTAGAGLAATGVVARLVRPPAEPATDSRTPVANRLMHVAPRPPG